MRVIHRVRKIRQLQREVATPTNRKQVRKDKLTTLTKLMTLQIGWEDRQDSKKQRTA